MKESDGLPFPLDAVAPSAAVEDLFRLGLRGNWPREHRPTFADLFTLRESERLIPQAGEGIHDETLLSLRFAPNVMSLDLGSTRVSDAGMAHLRFVPLLEGLDVSNTCVGDEGLCRLLGHSRLRRVTAMNSEATIVGERMLRALLPGCDVSKGRSLKRGYIREFNGEMFVVSHDNNPDSLHYVELRDCAPTCVAELVHNPIGRRVVLLVGEAGEPDRIKRAFVPGDEIGSK